MSVRKGSAVIHGIYIYEYVIDNCLHAYVSSR